MKKIIFTLILLFINFFVFSQNLQLVYYGKKQKIIAAVAKANEILNNSEFYGLVNKIETFDNTTFSGAQIIKEMKSIKTVEVVEYYKRNTKTNAKTSTKIRLNTAKLNRYLDPKENLASITKTLIHESIHAVDWLNNQTWDYTHRTQKQEKPPISAPYVIGEIGRDFCEKI